MVLKMNKMAFRSGGFVILEAFGKQLSHILFTLIFPLHHLASFLPVCCILTKWNSSYATPCTSSLEKGKEICLRIIGIYDQSQAQELKMFIQHKNGALKRNRKLIHQKYQRLREKKISSPR